MIVNLRIDIDSYDSVQNLVQMLSSMGSVSSVKALDESGQPLKAPVKAEITGSGVEGASEQNLRPITVIDFYKKINAANLSEAQGIVINHVNFKEEVQTW
ncbi:hypothetical protein [Microscilla marina]|uniref:Uncharacterized protein n=1 Tax=Microscilla marina ATCC 23134 TaxID=313606 RepID=A1ZNV5_MICM2|nr:hypothetical protein [Microscilla marina]EAY27994.1 hypothetical protein M23134_02663 [Microscilla marina ATCC 23134]